MNPRVTWFAAALSDVPTDDTWIDDTMAKRLSTMRFAKRRSETTLARWTAKSTVAMTLGIPDDLRSLRDVVVRNATDGAPFVEVDHRIRDIVIAMTDRADHAVCMVLAGNARIGCDMELVEPRTQAFVDDYFTEAERITVAGHGDPQLAANLIWSAKESALKVLRTGLRSDTRTVEVEIPEPNSGPWHPLTVTNEDGRRFPGWWLRSGEFVLTCATEVPTDPPESMTNPHGLVDAVPTHTWMDSLRARRPGTSG